MLWEQHATWTRMTIISIAEGLPDEAQTITRLLRNPGDILVQGGHDEDVARASVPGEGSGNFLILLAVQELLGVHELHYLGSALPRSLLAAFLLISPDAYA